MNTKSVRFRLTLWYSLAFFIAIAVIFTGFYLLTNKILFDQTDATLASHGITITQLIRNQGKETFPMMAREAFTGQFSETPGMVIIIMDKDGNIVGSSHNIESIDQDIIHFFDLAALTSSPIITNHTLGTQTMRFWINPVRMENILTNVVIIAHPIDVIQKSMNSLLVMLGIILFILIVPTIVGGYLLAKSAINPITRISQQLKKISSENLEERVIDPQTGDEINELVITFNNLLDRLNQAFKRERQFIGDVAHELKTPLTILKSSIEVALAKERTREDYKKTLTETLIDTDKISNTVRNILDLAWSEADQMRTQSEVFDLSQLSEELKDLASKMALKKQISIDGTIEPQIMLSGRRDKLERALLNIIDNAIKYTPDHGKVAINLFRNRNNAVFSVRDSGAGIAKKDFPFIFDRFYRGSTKAKTFGAGLGLAISRAIIVSHHGEINVDSKSGRGSTFTIILPLS